MTPWLSDAEIRDLCDGLTQPAAQCRYLQDRLGLAVSRKPNGRPLVLRSAIERTLGPSQSANAAQASPAPRDRAQPNAEALQLVFARR